MVVLKKLSAGHSLGDMLRSEAVTNVRLRLGELEQAMTWLARHFRQNLVGYLALAIALGGTAYAAVVDNSVGTRHLRNGAVTRPKIEDGAVTKAKIVPGVVPYSRSKLTKVDFATSPPLDPPASPDDPDRYQPLEFTMPFRGKVTITAIIPWWWNSCSAGSMRAGLYVDGNPVPATHQNVPSSDSDARGSAFVGTLTLARGPHRADIGVDCPDGNPSSGSFSDMVWNVIARK